VIDTIVNVDGVFEYITLLIKITRSILTHQAESYPGIIPFIIGIILLIADIVIIDTE
jgi:hypothetical protein